MTLMSVAQVVPTISPTASVMSISVLNADLTVTDVGVLIMANCGKINILICVMTILLWDLTTDSLRSLAS